MSGATTPEFDALATARGDAYDLRKMADKSSPAPSKIDALPVAGDLLPCPFCSGTNLFKSRRFDGAEIFRVGCNACNVAVEDYIKQAAISTWNRRAALAPTTPVPAEPSEPVAWQERQQTREGWTSWYDAKAATAMGKGPGLSEKLGGIEYQWRPLYATPAIEARNDAEVWTALGYLSGLHPYMTIDPDQPMKMAEAIFENVQAEIRQWQDKAVQARAMLEAFHRSPATPAQQTQSDAVAGAGWRPIDSAPKDGNILLAYAADETHEDGFVSQGYWMEGYEDSVDDMGHDSGFVDSHFDFFSCPRSFGSPKYLSAGTQPTHWMPLPAAPGATPPQQATPTMQDALAAGDGTLHGAIDYWQERALKAEAAASIKPDVQGTPTIASTAPERIWLDLGEGVDRHEPGVHFRECHEVTWSEDNATCNGIEYVRAALKEAPGGGT